MCSQCLGWAENVHKLPQKNCIHSAAKFKLIKVELGWAYSIYVNTWVYWPGLGWRWHVALTFGALVRHCLWRFSLRAVDVAVVFKQFPEPNTPGLFFPSGLFSPGIFWLYVSFNFSFYLFYLCFWVVFKVLRLGCHPAVELSVLSAGPSLRLRLRISRFAAATQLSKRCAHNHSLETNKASIQ